MPLNPVRIPKVDMPPLDLGRFDVPASMAKRGVVSKASSDAAVAILANSSGSSSPGQQPQRLPQEPLTWDQFLEHPAMRGLADDQIEGARREYFSDVVAPSVPIDQIDQAWAKFDADTNPGIVPKLKRGVSRLVSGDLIPQPPAGTR